MAMSEPAWVQLNDESLLEMKISGLKLSLEGSGLEKHVQQLYRELEDRGLVFHPPCHIGDEWFCPVGIPAIYIPFFLVHPRLRKLERRQILEVEGETPEWFMQLMRHEAGHAYSYAYFLYRKKKWQSQFGLASQEQSDFYRPRPYSHSFVIHLDDWYAQSHPDEDFAETFAVWLTPELDWRRKYRGWKALRKLEYVDELMRSLAGTPPVHQPAYRPQDYDCLSQKLKTYYAAKRKLYEQHYPDFYDRDLRRIFGEPGEQASPDKASRYLKSQRRLILQAVCDWTRESKYRVNQLLGKLIERCDKLDLRLPANRAILNMEIASYITTMIMNYLFTGRFTRSK